MENNMTPLKLTAPVEKVCFLERTDKAFGVSGTTILVRQATMREHTRRADYFAKLVREITENSEDEENAVRLIQHFSIPELMRLEAMLTVVESNITDEHDKPLFYKGMSEKNFNDAWGKLPVSVAVEMHESVLDLNPDWIPFGLQKSEIPQETVNNT